MFGKKKKEPKVEKLIDNASNDENVELNEDQNQEKKMSDQEKLIMGVDKKSDKEELSEGQKRQIEQLGSVKEKIAKILKSSNIEIVDENFGDEYDSGSGEGSDAQKQQEYDSLKALFGDKEKTKKELTLTIDEFDYTYTGKYLDEFDMMHLKSIKRIRLQNKYAKKIRKIALISSIILVLIGSGIAAYFMMREQPVYLKSISLNQAESVYYNYEYFDYSGLYIIAEYSNGTKERIKLKPSHLVDTTGNMSKSGDDIQFTGTVPAVLKFSYGGKTVDHSITVENKRMTGLAAIYSDGLFNLSAGDLINQDNLKILNKYANYNTEYIDYGSNISISINGVKCSYVSANKSFVASVDTKPSNVGENSAAQITISSGEISLTFGYQEGVYFVETE